MRTLAWLHHWTGGLIGLLLAILGLTGTILVFKNDWISAPGAQESRAQTVEEISRTMRAVAPTPETQLRSIIFANESFGLHQINISKTAGYYMNSQAKTVAQWSSTWDRPEHWLFDIHHHLLIGDTGELISGIAGLVALLFIISGSVLWWPSRRLFRLLALPQRMTRSSIVRHHRDLGIVVAPILFIVALTGAMMAIKPVAGVVLWPWISPDALKGTTAPPDIKGGPLSSQLNWNALFLTAKQQFPNASVRIVIFPKKPGDLLQLRMKQPEEWLHNGRTLLWFAPDSGKLIAVRSALTMPQGARLSNMLYPVHAGNLGNRVYQIIIALSGVALTLLGTLTTFSFWRRLVLRAR